MDCALLNRRVGLKFLFIRRNESSRFSSTTVYTLFFYLVYVVHWSK